MKTKPKQIPLRRKSVDNFIRKTHVLTCDAHEPTSGYWDNSIPPVFAVDSGEIVEIETRTHLQGRMAPGVTINDWVAWYRELIERTPEVHTYPDPLTGVRKIKKGAAHHTLTGPIYVHGAMPGDILQIEILKIIPVQYAFNLIPESTFLKAGLLPDDFPTGKVKWYRADLKKKKFRFLPGIEIPVRPFPGTIGVELPREGKWSNVPPGRHGGNIDNKDLIAGTVLYLPVWVEGAGLKTGDSHLAQGHGEVDLNGLEGAFKKLRLRLTVRKDLGNLVDWPFASTPSHWITMGFHVDLLEACKMAVRGATRFLNRYYGLPEDEAYAFCSMAVDLHVTQAVDHAVGIHAMIPKASFVGKQYSRKNGVLLQT